MIKKVVLSLVVLTDTALNYQEIQFSGGKDEVQRGRKSEEAGKLAAERKKRMGIRKRKQV